MHLTVGAIRSILDSSGYSSLCEKEQNQGYNNMSSAIGASINSLNTSLSAGGSEVMAGLYFALLRKDNIYAIMEYVVMTMPSEHAVIQHEALGYCHIQS